MSSLYFDAERLNELETVALRAAKEVASTLSDNFGKVQYKTKSDERDWVTEWDSWAEQRIGEQLTNFDSEIGILGEETGISGNQEVYWTIDAIDGTSGFVRGIDTCTTMISLVEDNSPVVAVINDFMRGVSYSATARGGAFMNEVQRLSVSKRPLSTAYIERYVPNDIEVELDTRLRAAGAFILSTASAGHMFTSIARGATEGFVSFHNPYGTIWDYAPGALLVHEAGGVVLNVDSDTYKVDNFDLIASNNVAFNALREAVREL